MISFNRDMSKDTIIPNKVNYEWEYGDEEILNQDFELEWQLLYTSLCGNEYTPDVEFYEIEGYQNPTLITWKDSNGNPHFPYDAGGYEIDLELGDTEYYEDDEDYTAYVTTVVVTATPVVGSNCPEISPIATFNLYLVVYK